MGENYHISWAKGHCDGTLYKESTSYNDIFDAFRLALKFYHFEDSGNEHH
jgi:hypothetical protein